MLFLHGFGGTAAHWEPLCRELTDIHAVAVDLPGHGDNAGTALDVPARSLDADLADLAAGLGGPDGVVVAGHSLGALVALRLAIVAPHRVRGLVLLTSGLPFRMHPELADQLSRGALDQAFLAGCLRRPSDPVALRLVSEGFRRMRVPPSETAAVWGIGAGETDIGDHSRVRAPVLVIVAGKDVVTSLYFCVEDWRAGHRRLVLVDLLRAVTHFWWDLRYFARSGRSVPHPAAPARGSLAPPGGEVHA